MLANTDEAICKRKADWAIQGEESIGACQAAPLRKQSHKKENQGEMEKDEGKREETAQVPDGD